MIRKNKLTYLAIISIFINIFWIYFNLITWEKKYHYSQKNISLSGEIVAQYSKEVSNMKIISKTNGYKKIWKTSIPSNTSLLVLKFPKDKDYSKIWWNISINWQKIPLEIDSDWDERMITDDFGYSTPIYVNNVSEINYEIVNDSKEFLNNNIELIAIDSSKYNENIALKIPWANADDNEIISRKDWWADETLRYKNNPKWVAIYKQMAIDEAKPKTARQLKQAQRIVDIRQYLAQNFSMQDTPVKTTRYEWWNELVWPIEKTKRVEKIIIHHTAEWSSNDWRSDAEAIRSMYYYHTITRWWWDIWYNYIVGKDGKIYEWRAWWDYVVAAHNLWNNKSTVWISVIWNFQNNNITAIQKNWVDRAIWIMSQKYWIDLNKTSISHRECASTENCLLKDFYSANLIWHRDAWSTSCPWTNLYTYLWDFRELGKIYSTWLAYIENTDKSVENTTLQKWPNIRIKLSYSWETIDIKSYTQEKILLQIWNRSGKTKLANFHIQKRPNNQIALVIWTKSLRIPSIKLSSTVLEIPSWSRKPSWDKSGNINDNKFRWTLEIYNDNWILTVINELPLEDYLKWLAEISNNENEQKAKVILTSARSYALWYTKKENRKFEWKNYDWSDDPDVFQKYLWYSFETRSVNISNYVDETNWEVITYSWQLIKPWYFNQSNWQTRSYTQYCELRKKEGSLPINTICTDIPFLQSVIDPAWIADGYKWHWVGISGNWAKALADQGKNYKDIIKYFLNWVEIEKIKY